MRTIILIIVMAAAYFADTHYLGGKNSAEIGAAMTALKMNIQRNIERELWRSMPAKSP